MSSSAKHLQSQHPCERGAARVKQHFCPVRPSLALHSLQHHLIGLPFSSIKCPGCKKSTEKQKAHLGDCHQRKQLGLLQAGNMHSHHSSQSCQETLHWDLRQGPAPKAALQKLSGEQQICSKFCNREATQIKLLSCKDNRPSESCSSVNLQTFHSFCYSSSHKLSHLNSFKISAGAM